jgi:glycosyltransferase involved in cell wall biosynthesis
MLSEDVANSSDYQVNPKIKKDILFKSQTIVDKDFTGSNTPVLTRSTFIVAIPAYNEEVAIGSVVARCKKYADHVIVVDDGSKDHTAEIARLVGAEVIVHAKNSGYGAAIKTCFEVARKRNVEAMIILDADGQHNPDDIPVLINELRKTKSDIVIGSRFVNGNGKNQKIPAYRKVGLKVLDTATRMSTSLNISDSQSGFRLYTKKAIINVDLSNNGMAAGSEILIQASDRNLKISEVPINVRYDINDTSTQNPFMHGISVLNSIIRLISQRRPMTFFGVPGAILLTLGIALAFMTFTIFNTTHNISILYSISSGLCILIGIFSIFTGLVLSAIQSIR